MRVIGDYFKSIDWALIVPLLAIGLIGVMAVHSASTASGVGGQLSPQARAHIIYTVLGLVLAFLVSRIGIPTYHRATPLFYWGALAALVLVLLVGPKISGAQRWLVLGPFRVQPSEFMKIALILYLARVMQAIQPFERVGLRRLFLPVAMIVGPALLVLLEPDLGTAVLLIGIGVLILLMCNVDRRLILVAVVAAAIAAPVVYQFGLKDYQRERVLTFLDPNRDPQGSGYNAIQSMIAVGSGRVTGKGYLRGTQSRLDFIPEQHTDFIFSAFSEEWGLLGVIVLLMLYAFVVLRIFLIATDGPTAFATLFCLGYGLALSVQIFVNIAMVTGLLPIVGIALPLISYGGSSVVSNYLAIGLCMGIKRHQHLFH